VLLPDELLFEQDATLQTLANVLVAGSFSNRSDYSIYVVCLLLSHLLSIINGYKHFVLTLPGGVMKHRAVMVSGLDVLLTASKRLQQKKILSLKDRLLSLFQSHVRL
jgi:hypothetical protein